MSFATDTPITLQTIPREVQLNLLTYLRAYDLSAVQQTCRFYNDPDLIDSLVHYVSDHVYSPQYTKEIVKAEKEQEKTAYTLEHLRVIELSVVACILSLPEPKQGFYVSKAWIKKTLLWLETVNEPPRKKKLNKKQQRQRARRLRSAHGHQCPKGESRALKTGPMVSKSGDQYRPF